MADIRPSTGKILLDIRFGILLPGLIGPMNNSGQASYGTGQNHDHA